MTTSNVSDSLTLELATRTASIIPFPARKKPSATAAATVSPEVRLARALKSLSVALAEQRVAVAAWRDALGELKTTTSGLNESLTAYRLNLQSLGDSVATLKSKARALEAIADGAVARTE